MSSTIDWRSIEDDREKYKAYLCSEEWGQLRRQVHERAGGKCERCKRADSSHTHHLTYERKYQEELADLQALCLPCHDFVHGRSEFDPNSIAAEWGVAFVRQIKCVCCGGVALNFRRLHHRRLHNNLRDYVQVSLWCTECKQITAIDICCFQGDLAGLSIERGQDDE